MPPESLTLFHTATRARVGNGNPTLFWEDRWLDSFRVTELAPSIYARVSRRIKVSMTVGMTLINGAWVGSIGPDLSAVELQ